MLGALLHASGGTELRSNVVIALALLTTISPAISASSDDLDAAAEGGSGDGTGRAGGGAPDGAWAGKLLLRLRGISLLGELLRSTDQVRYIRYMRTSPT